MVALTNGLRNGKFLFFLYKNDLKTMSNVLHKATKYMNVALLAREEKLRKRKRQEDVPQDSGQKMARTEE